MDWFNNLGGFAMFFPDTPALAMDFTLRGPADHLGYRLANSMQRTPTDLEAYPQPGMDFTGLGG